MAKFFRVRDFERLQHYKERRPPWIKLYSELLDDYEFSRLHDTSKAHLLCIFLLASLYDNRIPLDPGWVARRINAKSFVDLEILQQAGFIHVDDSASEMLAARYQDARPETETKTEAETEKTLSDKSDADVPKIKRVRKTYPEEFESFWRDYPTDPIMSKSRSFAQWQKLAPEDQRAAHQAVPAFRAYCARHVTYHPVHAERFLSQRRFDGFKPGAAAAGATALYRDHWNGAAGPLVDKVGAGDFHAWFADAGFEPGPPARLIVSSPFRRDRIETKFGALLGQLYGNIKVECLS